jgi:hypothetical protein
MEPHATVGFRRNAIISLIPVYGVLLRNTRHRRLLRGVASVFLALSSWPLFS